VRRKINMNNLKKAGCLAMIAIFAISAAFVPFTPTNHVQPVANTNSDVSTPQDVLKDIQKYVDTQREGGPIGSILASYRDTGYIPNTVSRNDAGDMGVLVTVKTDSDVASLNEIMDVNWKVEIGSMTVASGFITSPEAVTALENFDGIVTAFADSLYNAKTTGVEPRPSTSPPTVTEPQDLVVDNHIGADQVWSQFGIDGTGVTVGVIDTGTDFSQEGLVGTMAIGSDGLSMSYDPTGYGFVVSLYRANATVVNATAYLAYSSWNILSYKDPDTGKWYLDWSTQRASQGGSPYVNNQGGLSNLDWFYDAYMPAWWPGGSYPGNVTAMTEYYHNVMRQDPEIPDPSVTLGSPTLNITVNAQTGAWQLVPYYTAGYAFQQRNDPYMKVFAPVLVLNGTKVIVDWNTTRAHTDFWNANVNYGIWDFDNPAAAAYYNAMADWSFVDDYEDGLYYTPDGAEAHLNMYYDYPSDGLRFGLGTLAHCWEGNIFGLGMIDGIGLSGRAIGIMYDGDSHGTFVAGEIAGQPTTYPIGLDGANGIVEGIAPGAKVMGVMTVGIVAEFNSMLFAAGFDYNSHTGYWEWNYDSAHTAQITSNSWGWVAPQYYELYGQYALIYAAMATPGFFNATHYPGMVQCFSAGNAGPGYATTTPPRAAQIINVGASTSYHTFENSYGPDQGFDQIADFSSRGPLTLGYPKPDVLAPGRNNYGLVPYYGETILGGYGLVRDHWAVYAGTSMACPLAAGLAALMLDANSALTPDMVKTIMQSTATDIGMDGLSQGHGVINAFAAVDFALNNHGYTFYSYDSVDNWGTATAEAWSARMNPYDRDNFINTTSPPGNYADGNLFFGLVNANDMVTMTVTGDNWVYGDMTWSAMQYVADQTTKFSFETFIYNETTSHGHAYTLAGYMNLNTAMEAVSAGSYTNLMNANYATISITGDQATFEDDSMWAFVFDWIDNSPANGIPDYYNTTTGQGDELTRIQYAAGTGNVLKIDLSSSTDLGTVFPNTAIISVHDDNIWSWPYTGGNTLQVTVQTWTLATDGDIGFADNANDADVTLTVPASPEYGVHQGFVIANNGTMDFKMPYSYEVIAPYDTAGTVMTLANGFGAVQTPYEEGAITAGWDSYYTFQSGDHATFVVDMTDATVNYLAARVNWALAGTDIDVAILDMTGFGLADSADAVKATTDSSLAIADISGATGMYIIYTTVNSVNGTDIPEEFTLTVVGVTALDEPTLELSWTSNDHPTPTVITAGGSAAGDHVMMTATWTNGINPGMPEFGITTTRERVLYGTLFYATGANVIPSDPDGAFAGIIDPSEFAWETAPGIVEGDNVRVIGDFDGADNDFMAWWSTTPMETRSYANNILGSTMASSHHPETDTFIADQSGSIDFAILNYAQDGGDYYLTVDTRVGLEPGPVAGMTKTIDTYFLLVNGTYSVLVDSDTGTNLKYSVEIPNVFIGNFFAPKVTVDAPVAVSSTAFNVSWSSTDRNVADVPYYQIAVSTDGGSTFQVLARNMTTTSFIWDSHGFVEKSNYVLRVRAFSLDFSNPPGLCSANGEENYWPGDFGDGFTAPFAAGDVPITTPPTTTTTPPTTSTTPTTPPVTGIDPLIIGLIGGIGVGVVVLLILFLIRKK
jgi:hypothetical protein